MSKYVLGIDNGGTSSKAVLFDLSGREIAQAKENTRLLTPRPSFTERDMEELWLVNARVVRETIRRAGVQPEEILGVSMSGHGKGLYLVGFDGKPARSGIVSTDSRAYDCIDRWNADGTAEKLFSLTCQSVMACQPVALLRWLMEHEPDVLSRTQYIFDVKDYIRFRLTGEAHAEITDMSGSNLVNLHTRQYDPQILTLLGLDASISEKLPPLADSFACCGRVTAEAAALSGLREGTPVAAGLFDIDACAIAMNVVDGEDIASIAGTWAINEYIAKAPVLDHSVKMNSLYCLPGYYLAEESAPTSASNLEWFVNNFLREAAKEKGLPLYETANLVLEREPDDNRIVFLPYLYGGCDDAKATGAFLGLDGSHTREDMLRAVYECVCFIHKLQVDRLNRSRETPAKAARLAGGVVNSPKWVQMFADVFEMPVETVEVSELGALGAAMTAAVAGGCFETLQDAAAAMTHPGRTYLPDPARSEKYRRKYEAFLAANEALKPLWKTLKR